MCVCVCVCERESVCERGGEREGVSERVASIGKNILQKYFTKIK